MEIIETKSSNKCTVWSAIAATLLVIGGVVLAGYFLNLIPQSTEITVWQFLLYSLIAFIPMIGGCIWMGALKDKTRINGHKHGALGFGLLLLLIGVILLGFNSGRLPEIWKSVLISWQMLLIVVALFQFTRNHIASGFILLIIGEFFIIPKIAQAYPASWLLEENFTATYWPMLLIAFGVLIVVSMIIKAIISSGNKERCAKSCNFNINDDKDAFSKCDTMDGRIRYNLVFTGREEVILDPEFKGGEINTAFAGATLDLRKTNLPEGTTYLQIDTVFGGVNIYAPSDWNIEIRNNSVFGGFNDKRSSINYAGNESRKLIIVANCVFGGGEIR